MDFDWNGYLLDSSYFAKACGLTGKNENHPISQNHRKWTFVRCYWSEADTHFDWITPQQAAEKWYISTSRVQALCKNGQIDGVMRLGQTWLIQKSDPNHKMADIKTGANPKNVVAFY